MRHYTWRCAAQFLQAWMSWAGVRLMRTPTLGEIRMRRMMLAWRAAKRTIMTSVTPGMGRGTKEESTMETRKRPARPRPRKKCTKRDAARSVRRAAGWGEGSIKEGIVGRG